MRGKNPHELRAARRYERTMRALPGPRLSPLGGGVVLCYHLVGGGVGGPVDLDVDVFDTHLAYLRQRDVQPLSVVAHTGQGIALTFDDAFENFAHEVWPRLKAARLPATLFVPTGFVDGTHPSPLSTGPLLRPCSWDQLRQMHAEGLDVGSHTHSHQNLRRQLNVDIDVDLRLASRRLDQELGKVPTSLCYPKAKWSPRVEAVARRHHVIMVTGGGGRVFAGRPFRVPRRSVVRGGPGIEFVCHSPLEPREWLADKVRQWRS